MMKKIFNSIVFIIILFTLSGCFNYKEINDYEQLLNQTSIQYANQLFKNNKDCEKAIKRNLTIYTAKLDAYRNIAKEITKILNKKGD